MPQVVRSVDVEEVRRTAGYLFGTYLEAYFNWYWPMSNETANTGHRLTALFCNSVTCADSYIFLLLLLIISWVTL